MKLPEISVKHPVTTAMVFLALLILGLVSLSQLGLELLPDISFPTVVVFTPYPGVGPEEIESSITESVEDAVSTLNGVERISSVSSEGVSMVIINFTWRTNMETIVGEIREKLTAIEDDLPAAAERSSIVRFNPEFLPSIVLNVSSPTAGLDLRRLSEQSIVPELEKIEGVATVEVFGGKIAAVTCTLDLNSIRKLEIPILNILRVFEAENVNLPAGSISVEDRYIVLRALGEFNSLRDIEKVLIGYKDTVPVYLKDVAEVGLGYLPREQTFRTEMGEGVQLAVRKQPGHNTVDINREAKEQLRRLQQRLPPSVEVSVQSDQSTQILNSIGSVARAAWQGGLLAVLVLLFFLRSIPSTLIISIAIPVSVVATFSLMNFAGISMNIVSLLGITLGVGMFVDNSIVVLESNFRKTLAGVPPREAAVAGTAEVGTAITASTLTTLVVFFPLVFVKDFAGLIFQDLAYTVAFALFISLVMALTLVPVLCSRFLRLPETHRLKNRAAEPEAEPQLADLDVSLAEIEVHTGNRIIDGITRGIRDLLLRLDELYERGISWALRHTATVIVSAVVLLLISLTSLAALGMEFMPESDEGQFAISMETRIGSSFERTGEKVLESERIIRELSGKDLTSISTSVGRGGTMQGTAERGSHLSVLEVRLVDKDRRGRTIWQTINELSKRLPQGVMDSRFRFSLQGVGALATTVTGDSEPIVIGIRGDDLQRSYTYAQRIASRMKRVHGIRDVELSFKTGKPELQFRIRRKEAGSLGLSPLEIAATLRTAYKGSKVSTFRGGDDKYDVYVILREEDRDSLKGIQKLFFVNSLGEAIPLENVVEVVRGSGPLTIERENRMRVIKVTAALTGERALNRVMAELQETVAELGAVPPGLELTYSGSYRQMRESFRSLFFVLILAVALVYMVLASQFENLIHPLIVMFSVPFSVIGLVAALVVTGTTFSIMSFIGAILLVGIVVNNAIVLIDYMNRLQGRGLGLREAIIRGGKTRLKPILMTSFTTIFGLLPMAIGVGAGSELRAPLGRAVVGGLLTSGFVTLILIPTVYWLVESRIRKRQS
ncbi:MAG: efflux RND transporter permease subunit [Spirochaetaceae bacterium]|nr:MAG: efflux RND transporter permease subunit [Spirochaetaceae bacterium]